MSQFSALAGNDHIKRYLERAISSDNIAGSLLFCGPEGVGKHLFAVAFAKAVLRASQDEHPDLFYYQPEGKTGMHSIDTMRSFTREVYLAPFSAKKKFFIIDEADRMLPTSANALLKTFEEPPKESVIILICSRPEKLLPTILSRCQKLVFRPLTAEEQEVAGIVKDDAKEDPLKMLLLNALSDGSFKSYSRIVDAADMIAVKLEKQLKEKELLLRAELIDSIGDRLTASQKEGLSREIEGQLSRQKNALVKDLLLAVYSWHRDLHLLNCNGPKSLLMNPLHEEVLRQVLQSEELPSLHKTKKAVADALLSLERSTTLKICLENFLMQISHT